MDRVFSILKILICIILCLQTGCSTFPTDTFKNKIGESAWIDSCPERDDSDSAPIQQAYNSDFLLKKNGLIISDAKPCKIKYHKLNCKDRNIVVESQIGSNKYPAVLDTGASQAIFFDAALVKKNKLPVYSLEDGTFDFNGNTLGICRLPELQAGEVEFKDWSAIYIESHSALNFLGIPIASITHDNESIILGLPLLRKFKYIEFDNIIKEAELSYSQSFEPSSKDEWEKYPISIEEDFHGNMFLFVRLSIAGRKTEVQLDTGSGKGLAIGDTLWKQIKNQLNGVKLKKRKDFYPYIGNLSCKKGKVSKLEFGNSTVKNAEISIFSDDCPLLDGCEGLVGMQYFQNSVIVLDFERDLMWLKEQEILK